MPNSVVVVPIRPYTAAVGAAASSRASRRMVAASMPVAASTASAVNGANSGTHIVEAGEVRRHVRTRIGETFVEQRVGDRGQQQRVRAGTDRQPLVGLLGRAATPRIDDHEPAAPRLHRLDTTREVGGRAQASVRRVRVGAEHDEEVGAVEVGHRDRRPAFRTRTRRRRGVASDRRSTRCSAAACRGR